MNRLALASRGRRRRVLNLLVYHGLAQAKADFLESVRRAAWQAGRSACKCCGIAAGSRRPSLSDCTSPESCYLKAIFCRVDGSMDSAANRPFNVDCQRLSSSQQA